MTPDLPMSARPGEKRSRDSQQDGSSDNLVLGLVLKRSGERAVVATVTLPPRAWQATLIAACENLIAKNYHVFADPNAEAHEDGDIGCASDMVGELVKLISSLPDGAERQATFEKMVLLAATHAMASGTGGATQCS